MERRVVSQLAMAHERQLIRNGCTIKLSVPNREDLLTKPHSSGSEGPQETWSIKLQILKEGSKNKYLDLDLNVDNPFTSDSRWMVWCDQMNGVMWPDELWMA